MTTEIYWLVLATAMTGLFWVPYVLDRAKVFGIPRTLATPSPDDPPLDAWAQRAQNAHKNAVENLVVFAALILAAQVAGVSTAMTALAAQLYFWARLIHFIVYVLGIPGVRTLAFLGGFVAQAIVALTLLGA